MASQEYSTISKIRLGLRLITPSDLKKLKFYSLLQIFINLLDFFGLILVGIITARAFQGINNSSLDKSLIKVFEILRLDSFSFQQQIAFLSLMAAVIFVTKTISSLILTKKVFKFLTTSSANFSIKILKKFVNKQLSFIERKSPQEIIHIVVTGVDNIFIGIIANGFSLVVDIFLLLIILLTLATLDISLTIIFLLYFVTVAILIFYFTYNKTKILGLESSQLSIRTAESISEILAIYKILYTSNNLFKNIDKVSNIRLDYGKKVAQLNFLPLVSKYIIEGSIIIGSLVISLFTFIRQDASTSITLLVMFMAASTRIAPAVLRIQQTLTTISMNLGSTKIIFDFIADLSVFEDRNINDNETKIPLEFSPRIDIHDLNFRYSNDQPFTLNGINLSIEPQEFVAFIGKSGSGKSTLVNLILGLNNPNTGQVLISNLSPQKAIKTWPGKIALVPQEVILIGNSLLENITLGVDTDTDTDRLILAFDVLQKVQLGYLAKSPNDLKNKSIMNLNSSLSGGEKQRLGIARALFSKPKVLILDEATSSLDVDTESLLVKSLDTIRKEITIIIVAHRHSTIRNADKIIYLDQGKILSQGSITKVRSEVSNFDDQMKNIGII